MKTSLAWIRRILQKGKFYPSHIFFTQASLVTNFTSRGGGASQNVKICKRFNIRDRWDPQFIPSCVYSPSASCSTFFRNSMRLGEIQIQRRDLRCNFPKNIFQKFCDKFTASVRIGIHSQLAEKCADNQIFCDRWASPFIPVVFAALFANASQPKPHQADEITEKRFRR